MMEQIKHTLREQCWRTAATIGGVTAAVGSVCCAIRLPDDAGLFFGIALVGIMVAMASECRS